VRVTRLFTLFNIVNIFVQKNYIFCCHPHGVLCYGVVGALGTEGAVFSKLFPGLKPKLITLEGSFWLPGAREVLLGVGGCSSSKKSIRYLLSRGQGIAPVLMVGGLPEISNYNKDKIVLVIKKRKGFIKLALEAGADLVPVLSFGETEIFHQPKGVNSFLEKYIANSIGFYPVVFSGRGYFQNWFGVLPQKKELNVVVGKPIDVTMIETPSPQDVEDLHQRYIAGVTELYNENKSTYGYQDVQLEII
jgi:2-acylglycerol O-acyltransferase 2